MRNSNSIKAAYLKKLDDRIEKALTVVGAHVVGKAVNYCSVQTGNLSHSINYVTSKYSGGVSGQTSGTSLKKPVFTRTVKIGTNVVYAAIQEFGGTIRPNYGKSLAVPIHPDAKAAIIPKGGSIRSVFPDLVLIKRKSGAPLLVRMKGKQFDIMYVLMKSVTIPAHPYLRPAVYNHKDDIGKIFAQAMKDYDVSMS